MTQKVATTLKYVMATHAAEKMIPSHKAVRLCEKMQTAVFLVIMQFNRLSIAMD